MHEPMWQTDQFESHRAHLQAVAHRMLGSVGEAEDAVQETWLRLNRSETDAVTNLAGWLTKVVSRVCLDMLRARRSRREDYVGTRLPELVVRVDDGDAAAEEVLLADSVGIALLVVLETLTPAERLAFVLHDMFAVPFEEIAPVVERTTDAARKLASRARRRVREVAPSPQADPAKQREVVSAFLAASRAGNFDALVRVLDPGVVFRHYRALVAPAEPVQIHGAGAVADAVLSFSRSSRLAHLARPAVVNGIAGIVVGSVERPGAVGAFTVVGGSIVAIDLITDPEQLRGIARDKPGRDPHQTPQEPTER
jgi:RNA polymerase sigma-70 factor (ECF subfamily)